MSLHSSDYIRDLVGHVPSKVLSLRQDEVSVFYRMNTQGRRRVSLPSKLSGITEKENSDGSDMHESLKMSYSQMKNKLDELEEYNQNLENKLHSIFNSISTSVKKAERSGDPLIEHSDNLKHIIIEEDCNDLRTDREIINQSSFTVTNVKLDKSQIDAVKEDEAEQRKLIIPKTPRIEISKLDSPEEVNKYHPELYETSRIMSSNQELTNIVEDEEEEYHSPAFYQRREDEFADINGSDFYEVKKHLILHLEEDTIRPIRVYSAPKHDGMTQRSKSTGEKPLTLYSESTEMFQIKYKEIDSKQPGLYSNDNQMIPSANPRTTCDGAGYQCGQIVRKCSMQRDFTEIETNDDKPRYSCSQKSPVSYCEKKTNKLLSGEKLVALQKRRRFSSVEHHPFSTLSEVKREEKARRRISTGSHISTPEYKLESLAWDNSNGKKERSIKVHDSENNNYESRKSNSATHRDEYYFGEHKNKDQIISSSFYTTELSSYSSLATSVEDSIEYIEDLPVSPPEYLNFHDESECMDEFFLFPEEVLNVDFDTVCEELARFSKDMEKVLKRTENNLSFLKAAKASDEWKTLWIYRGM
eukprot:GFUD01054579.1.p1 GENE.GFUD01054579.1~~GFUD01054579.1.p1  ORF type:complete len:584 (+),score=154.31 GFUD01054579.1:286-2037(+)